MIVIEDQARSIFLAALEREPDQWPAYLDEACADNADLRARVNELLEAHREMGTIHGGRGNATAIHQPTISEGPGSVIGPYKLLQQIGEGGMGVVFMAEQADPIQRTVALKIIKAGMDTRQVIARFEAERQALAMMDHPNIAKVLDAGTTESGRPYFVMELVKGVPITRYCDEKHLSLRERLELFLPVCQAVQHAHQKGIIHRDIKPTNVLVAEYDNHAIPKVIDFGVAKATAQRLTERTMFTEFGQVIGTVEYMSPEQAKLNQLDIDTRSDIYSLGVLLYELLTGSTPFEQKRLREAAFDEVLRIIREEEPPKPSTKLSASETLPSIAANRHSEPARLSKDIRGELDWIVMKCLEKDRSRRYETANGLAADIQHHLHDEPVHACPPSAVYRFRKFALRNKAALMVASLIAAALILGLVGTTWQAIRATHAERAAQAQRDRALEAEKLATAESERAEAEAVKATTSAETARAVIEFLNRDLLGQTNDNLPRDEHNRADGEITVRAALDRAAGKLEARFPDKPLVEAAIRNTIGQMYFQFGDEFHPQAEPHLARALELRRIHLGEDHVETIGTLMVLATVRRDLQLQRNAAERARRALGEEHQLTLWCKFCVALHVGHIGQEAEAISLFREVLAAQRRTLGSQHPETAWTVHCLAGTLHRAANRDPTADREIEDLYREALSVSLRTRGDWSWHTLATALNLGQFLRSRGRLEEAAQILEAGYSRLESGPVNVQWTLPLIDELEALYREWAKPEQVVRWRHNRELVQRKLLARNARLLRENINDPGLLTSYGLLLSQIGRDDEAEAAYRMALGLQPDDPRAQNHLGDLLSRRGQHAEAEAALRAAIRLDGENPWHHSSLAHVLFRQDKFVEAEAAFRETDRLQPDNGWNHHCLGDVLARQHKWAEAEAAYREAFRLDRDGDHVQRLGQALVDQGKLDEALIEFRKAVEVKPTSANCQRALGHFLCYTMGQPENGLPALQEAVRLDPNNTHAHYDVGSAYAFTGQWDKSKAAFEEAAKLAPHDLWSSYRWATLCYYTNDRENYRRACRTLLNHFSRTDNKSQADCTAKACALAPGFGADSQQVIKLADFAMTGSEADPARKWFEITKGLVDYRAGRLDPAAEIIIRSAPSNELHRDALAHSILAMAQHRLGKVEAARTALAEAQRILATKMPTTDKGQTFGDDWHDWLHAKLLCREAEELLKETTTSQK